MADLFISYSREDSARAGQVAQGMIAAGFEVFWDTDVPPGQTWADYIEEKLSSCAAVIVLWSQHSTKSQWVREEARMGRERGKLIPACLDDSIPPFGFGEVQAANISAWNGEMQGHAGWDRLVGAVHNAVARAKGGEVSPPRAPSPPVPPHAAAPARPAHVAPPLPPHPQAPRPPASDGVSINKNVLIGGVALVAAIAVGVAVYFATRPPAPATPPVQQAAVGTVPGPGATQPAVAGAPNFVPPQPAQVTPPQGMTAEQYMAPVRQRVAQIQQALGSQGWTQSMASYESQLNNGAQESIPGTLYAGYDYMVVGVCDQDCTDLDLRLRDQAGAVIDIDTEVNDEPHVEVRPPANGSYVLDVHMATCSSQPCFYSVAVFQRAAQ